MTKRDLDSLAFSASWEKSRKPNCWTKVAVDCGLVEEGASFIEPPRFDEIKNFFKPDVNGKYVLVVDNDGGVLHADIVVGEETVKETREEYNPNSKMGQRLGFKVERFNFTGKK